MEALSKTQLLVWSKPLPTYNTFIGGVGEDYPTASDLSTAMSLPPEAIQRFTVDENYNILCRIDRTYNLVFLAFSGKKLKGYYIDEDGLMNTGAGAAFSGFKNLKLKLRGLTNYPSTFNSQGSMNLGFFPEVTSIGSSGINQWFNGTNRLYIQKTTSINASAFTQFNQNKNSARKQTIYINSAMTADARLLYAQSQGATLKAVSNFDTPNKITDLSAIETNARTVKLNFTTPIVGTNPIDFYEVWFQKLTGFSPENRFLPSDSEIKNSNEYGWGLEPNSQYAVYLCTVDTMYNGSGMWKGIKRANSNEILVTTPALSGYQIGMSLYMKLDINSFDYNGLNGYGGDVAMTYSGGYAKFGTGKIDLDNRNNLSFTDGTNDVSAHIAFGFVWNDKTGIQFFLSKRGNTGSLEWDVALVSGNLRFSLTNPTSTSNAIKIEIPIASISSGVLNTIQFSYDGLKLHTGIKAYLNGISIGTSSSLGTYTGQVAGDFPLTIGDTNFTTYKFKGDMRHLALWKNRTMSPTEITEIDYRIKNNISLI